MGMFESLEYEMSAPIPVLLVDSSRSISYVLPTAVEDIIDGRIAFGVGWSGKTDYPSKAPLMSYGGSSWESIERSDYD